MFPDRQHGPHRDWKQEVDFLDNIFSNGAAYTIGKVNGDHWLLYLTSPPSKPDDRIRDLSISATDRNVPDYTIEILMSDLSPIARDAFTFSQHNDTNAPSVCAKILSDKIGISDIFPPQSTTLDAYAFTPCGYSANALIKWQEQSSATSLLNGPKTQSGEGYYTIHVTPEPGWSYASFECNVPLSVNSPSTPTSDPSLDMPDLRFLVERVVSIFQPARLTVTLFISSRDDADTDGACVVSPIDAAQRAFRVALTSGNSAALFGGRSYRRTDKINYEFGDYDLAFASFELRS